MLTYRIIEQTEKSAVEALMHAVLDSLENKEFFAPFTSAEIDAMFDENTAVTYGAYQDGTLVGTAQLYLGDPFVDEIKVALGIAHERAAEFGGVMVLPDYRGRGTMKHFSSLLIEEARKRGYHFLLAVAHAENTASNAAIQAMGATLMKTGNLSGHANRNMYLLRLV